MYKNQNQDNFKHEGMKKHEGTRNQTLMNLHVLIANSFIILIQLLFPKLDCFTRNI
jgi:hypothetical protein